MTGAERMTAEAPVSPYADADLYDVVYSWYTPDLEFYLATAREARGPVLEVGCGTGRVLIPTLQAGVDIDGIDLSPAMLERLRGKAAALGLSPRVTAADMRDFTLERRYERITIPFRSFMHLLTTGDQLRALRCIREHLEPGGRLVMNLFYPSFRIMAERENRRQLQREFTHPAHGGAVAFTDLTRYDRVNQTLAVERDVVETPPGAEPVTHRYGFRLRWTYRFEMELLLAAAGFSRSHVAGGYDGRPFGEDVEEMVWTAWRE